MNVFELMAKIGIDTSKYEEGLGDAESKTNTFASKIGSAIGGAAKVVGAASVAAVGAAGAGIASLTKQAVDAYGNYEQLVGGVEKIFGEGADAVMANANKAFSTAGMSANDYMETVTGFSATLIQGLEGDTEKAAEIADLAIRDMSDNANTYGTDMQSIQNAYMGFAKGNYAMLDNLKLGYGGTASEMIRLINDAQILDEEIDSLDDVSFDQMILAIHTVQENLNIAGTTAKEASGTIQGSMSSLQGAWQNLITGLGDSSADLGPLIDNVVQSAMNLVNNIKPVALQAVQGVATLIKEFAPIIAEELPLMIETILPPLIDAITLIVNNVTKVLPSLVETLLPPIISALITVMQSLVVIFPTILKVLASQLPVILQQLIPAILQVLPSIIAAVVEILGIVGKAFADNVDLLMEAVMSIIHYLVDVLLTPENIKQFILVATQIILTIAEGILKNIPEILAAIVILLANVLEALIEAFPEILELVMGFFGNLIEDVGDLLYEGFGDTLANLWMTITNWFDTVGEVISLGCEEFVKIFLNLGKNLISTVSGLWKSISTFFSDGWKNLLSGVTKFGDDLWESLTNIWDNAKKIVSDAINGLIKLFDFKWELPKLKLPHFTISGSFNLDPTNFQMPTIGVEWYKKAMSNPYMLEDATIFGTAGGKLLGAGESGKELIYGHDQLMKDIGDVVDSRLKKLEFIVPVYIGGKKIDQQIVTANARNAVISGGR